MGVTRGKILAWYIGTVLIVAVGVLLFGLLAPWMLGQPDTLMVTLAVAIYLIGVPVVGFSVYSLVQSIIKASKEHNEGGKDEE